MKLAEHEMAPGGQPYQSGRPTGSAPSIVRLLLAPILGGHLLLNLRVLAELELPLMPRHPIGTPGHWVAGTQPKQKPHMRGIVLWKPLPQSQAEDPEAPYFYTLGRLIHEFGKTELLILVALRQYAGLSDKRARDLLGDVSPARCAQAFKRISSDKPQTEQKEIADLLGQYSVIRTLRDHCAHRTADRQSNGTYVASNEATSKRDEDNEYLEFTIDDIWNATIDLNGIIARLSDITMPGSPNRFPVEVPPWKYKQKPIQKPLAKGKSGRS
jgi:hypothetical protein